MSKYKPVAGDRVRVVLEGEVNRSDSSLGTGFNLQDEMFYTGIDVGAPFVISIEKIEPPVEVFRPGDRLRSKSLGFEVTLGSDGYLHHYREGFVEFHSFPKADSFTSESYELVTRS